MQILHKNVTAGYDLDDLSVDDVSVDDLSVDYLSIDDVSAPRVHG